MNFLALLGGLFSFLVYPLYIRDFIKHEEKKPSKATWLIWLVLDFLLLGSMYSKDSVNLQIVACTIGASVVWLLSLKYGVKGWTLIDTLCVIGAAIGIVGWIVFSANWAIVSCSISAIIGAIPTLNSVFDDYRRESKLAWIMGLLAGVLTTLSIRMGDGDFIAYFTQPVAYLFISIVICFLLFTLPYFKKSTSKN